jgi:hypothetical protein
MRRCRQEVPIVSPDLTKARVDSRDDLNCIARTNKNSAWQWTCQSFHLLKNSFGHGTQNPSVVRDVFEELLSNGAFSC